MGDFNITRGSYSLELLFPGARHAYDEAGSGWGATYPRDGWPYLHIDHVLMTSDDLAATRYEIVDPGIGLRRLQIAEIRRLEGER